MVAWPGGEAVLPLLDAGRTVDPTGGGDAIVAGTTVALLDGADPLTAAWHGSAAAALTVTHAGGRPDLDPERVARLVARERAR